MMAIYSRPSRAAASIALLSILAAFSVDIEAVGDRGPAWSRHVIDVGLAGADGGRLLDADNDGDLDLSVGWEESGRTRLYLNPGSSGAVMSPWPFIDVGDASGVEDAVMGDLDGDGRIDVVSARDGGRRMTVHFAPTAGDYTDPSGWTTISFPPPAGNPRWMYSIIMDVDEDGALDIVAGGKESNATITWFRAPPDNRRDLGAWSMHELGGVGWLMSLAAHDMDNDNDLDLVLSDRKIGDDDLRGVRWLENPGATGGQALPWTNHFVYRPQPGDGSTEVMFMDLSDMDDDGLVDLVAPLINPPRLSWYRRLDTTGLSWTEYTIDFPGDVGQRAKSVRAGDLNNDGELDLILASTALTASEGASTSGVIWLEATGGVYSSAWSEHEVSGPDGIKFDDSLLLDLDGDGDLDIINTEEDAPPGSIGLGIIWYENPLLGGGPGLQPPSITTQPSDQSVIEGAPATFSVAATGDEPLSYQWQRNGVDMPDEVNTTLNLPSTSLVESGDQFAVVVTNGGGSVTSNSATLTVNPLSSASEVTLLDAWIVDGSYATQDATFNVSPGTSRLVLVALSAEKNRNGPLSVASVRLGDQQLTEVFDFTVGNSGAYHNVHWVGYLLEAQIATRNGSALTIDYANPPSNPFDGPKIHYASYQNVDQITPIIDSGSRTSGNASSLQLNSPLTAADGNKIVAFNVLGQHRNPGLSTPGYTEQTQSIGARNGHASAIYERNATTAVTQNLTFTSSTATRMAVSAVVLNQVAPVVNDNEAPLPNPMTWAIPPYATGSSSISMTATTASDANGVEYFFTNTAGGGNDSGWQDSPTYEDTGLDSDTPYTYTVMARDKSVNQNTTAASSAESATTDALQAPSIDTQPVNQTVTEGDAATFTVVATGDAPLSYQWQRNGVSMPGEVNASLTLPSTSLVESGDAFTVVVSNVAGSVTSVEAILTVNAIPQAPVITTQPVNQTVTEGDAAAFTVVATGDAPLSYQWQRNGVEIPGAVNDSLNLATTSLGESGDQFTVVVTNNVGSVTSTGATLTVNAAPPEPAITITLAECGPASGASIAGTTIAIPDSSVIVVSSGPTSVPISVLDSAFSFSVPGPIAGCPASVTVTFGTLSMTVPLTSIP